VGSPELLTRCGEALVVGAVLAAGILALSGYRVLVDRSGSMSPAIRTGDLLLTRTVAASSVSARDIVTFPDATHPGRTITHRVTAVRHRRRDLMFETRGDANPAPEFWGARKSQRVRVARFVVPGPGRLAPWLSAVPVPPALFFAAALLAAGATLRRIWA
jgi:signal peptidase I